ncbi:MAG: TetR/AcrR family transcriptional regulator [Deferribacterota bacterium]|nr:TetR/AcrR family transcriptional regulator [Deferribacterota bacterium]
MDIPATFLDFKNHERKVKRSIIIRAALKVFSEKPVQKVSMREIAINAGISHASIYRYFHDKDELFLEVFLMGLEELKNRLDNLIDKPVDKNMLNETANILIDYLSENDHYFMMMSQFMIGGNFDNKLTQNFNNSMKSFLDRIEMVIQKEGGKNRLRYLTHLFFSGINGILITFINYPGRKKEEVKNHMKKLALIFVNIFRDNIYKENNSL